MPAITSLRLASKRKQIVEIELDGAVWRAVDAEVVARFGLRKGAELNAGDLRRIEDEEAFVQARRDAVNFCARRPRTRREVENRLHDRRIAEATVERVMEELLRQRLFEDREVVRRHARKSERQQIGPRRAEAELAARGVEREAMQEELGRLRDPQWQIEQATRLAQKRLPRLAGQPLVDQKRKLWDYLSRRGFEAEVVANAINRTLDGIPDDAADE